MDKKGVKERILDCLRADKRLWRGEKNNEFDVQLLENLLATYDKRVIDLLFGNAIVKEKFFLQVGKSHIFKESDFKFFLEQNQISNSYTQYRNRIGLTDGKRFLRDTNDIVLNWPFKDCVLGGGQSSEDGMDSYFAKIKGKYEEKQERRKEIFFNEILGKDEIDRLLDEKSFVNWKRVNKKGECKVGKIERDESGTIRENLIIKGNNLLVLHSLKKLFAGKVKLIYIDPPYNTGNDGFKYNDKFNHSTWLTFMKNRLEVAREFLREDGVIYVQCDDNEHGYLKVLMDEIFGYECFISNSVVITNRGGRDYGGIARTHEYLLVYGKNQLELNELSIDESERKYEEDDMGNFIVRELRNRNIVYNDRNRPNLCYPIYVDPRSVDNHGLLKISLEKECKEYVPVMPLKSQKVQTVWRWSKEKVLENLNINVMAKKKKDGSYMIVEKYRKKTKRQRSVWDETEFINQKGTDHIKDLFGGKAFAYPKSESLISRIIDLSTEQGDIVLDYHLGSGTTVAAAHKMGRQYIGIEQMNYIEDIVVKRLEKVICGEQGGISQSMKWRGGGHFVYCNLAKWNESAREKIKSCKDLSELKSCFSEMVEKYFLNYNLKVKEFSEKIVKEKDFEKLTTWNQKKKMFLTMLDANQMYVQRSEMADKRFGISKSDQKLTEEFYNGEE